MVRYRHARCLASLRGSAILIGAAAMGPMLDPARSQAWGQEADAELPPRLVDAPIVPVHDEPHHRQLFQYGPTRILELQLPPGDISWYHLHEWPVLYLTLSSSRISTQNLETEPPAPAPTRAGGPAPGARAGGPPPGGRGGFRGRGAGPGASDAPQPSGPRAFSSTGYAERPVTHYVENIGTGLFRAMVVVNETDGDAEDAVPSVGFDGEPELVNPWFRTYRVTLEPGESLPAHTHETPVAILQATDGTGLSDGPMDWEYNEPGQWGFYDAGVEHSFRNTGGEPLELLEVEVRHTP